MIEPYYAGTRIQEILSNTRDIPCILEGQSIPERIATLEMLIAKLAEVALQARDAIDGYVEISSTKPWALDYRERKHLFLFAPTSLSLILGPFGTYVLPASTWTSFPFRSGLFITCTSTTAVQLFYRCTDEVVP